VIIYDNDNKLIEKNLLEKYILKIKSENLVNPVNGANTQTIECLRSILKFKILRKMHGTNENLLPFTTPIFNWMSEPLNKEYKKVYVSYKFWLILIVSFVLCTHKT